MSCFRKFFNVRAWRIAAILRERHLGRCLTDAALSRAEMALADDADEVAHIRDAFR